jgi:hypothetical protein
MKKPDTYRKFGLLSMGYGILFILIDKIDYLIQVERYKGILSQAYPEPMMLRIPNLIFSIAIIIAGYLLLKKKKESLYLYNFSFIGIILKYLFTLFLIAPFAVGNILQSYGIHLLVAITGLILVNQKNLKRELKINSIKLKVKFASLVIIASLILFFYGFENLIYQKMDREKHFKGIIYDSHLFSKNIVDTCYFAHDFIAILDTIEEIDDYSQIQILQLDSNSNPVYGERLSIYEQGVLSDYYMHNDLGLLTRKIQEKESFSGESDTLIFTYYNNDKIKSITEIYYFLSEHDTMTYHYNYLKENDTVYCSDNKGFNYCYTSILNDSNQILITKQVSGIYASGLIEYKYNSKGQIAEIIEHNQKEDNQKSIELFFYDKNGLLTRKEKNNYEKNSDKLESKELTMIVREKTKPNTASYLIWQGDGCRGTLPRPEFLPWWIGTHSRGIAKQGIARERWGKLH